MGCGVCGVENVEKLSLDDTPGYKLMVCKGCTVARVIVLVILLLLSVLAIVNDVDVDMADEAGESTVSQMLLVLGSALLLYNNMMKDEIISI